MGSFASRVAFLPLDGSSGFLPFRSTTGGSAGTLPYHSMPAVLHLGNGTTSGVLGVECLQPSLDFQIRYIFPSPALVHLVPSNFLAEHVKGELRLLILMAPCWMEASLLPTILNMLTDFPWHCPIVKDLIMDVLVGHMLKDLPYLHLTLWLLRDVFCRDRGSLPQSVRQWQGQLDHLWSRSASNVERNGQVGVLNSCTKQCHICPKLADILVHLFRVGLTWHMIGVYHSAF